MITVKGLDRTLRTLERFANIETLLDKIMNAFCQRGEAILKEAYSMPAGRIHATDGTGTTEKVNMAIVGYTKTADGYTLYADGHDLLFFEFGAGVKNNAGGRGYGNIPIPVEISPIGTYGHGLGKNKSWLFRGEDGTRYITSGLKAQHGFANVITTLMAEAPAIIKRIVDGG